MKEILRPISLFTFSIGALTNVSAELPPTATAASSSTGSIANSSASTVVSFDMPAISPAKLDLSATSSILGVAKTLAEGALQYYPGDAETYIDLPVPYYWWENGALMGALLDYSHYTNDSSYDELLTTALSAQAVSPAFDLMVPTHYGSEGNDDQAFWTFAVLSAAERNFPQASNASIPSYLQIAENAWNSIVARWNTSACGGGVLWQIFADNPNGLNYRNSVSNGGLFQISARLYRATRNQTYLDWANKVWDWSRAVQFVDDNYYVYDGADSRDDCTLSKRNNITFSYAAGIYLYGAAVLADATSNDTVTSTAWVEHAHGLLGGAKIFFGPYDNSTNIMYEHACEPYGTCNVDMKSFKGYLSRFMRASAQMVPSLASIVSVYLDTSAIAAAKSCSGGDVGTSCGQKWYTGSFDGSVGLGQSMSALEVVQGLLVSKAAAPYGLGEIHDVRRPPAVAQGNGGVDDGTPALSSDGGAAGTPSSAITSHGRSLEVQMAPSSVVALWAMLVLAFVF